MRTIPAGQSPPSLSLSAKHRQPDDTPAGADTFTFSLTAADSLMEGVDLTHKQAMPKLSRHEHAKDDRHVAVKEKAVPLVFVMPSISTVPLYVAPLAKKSAQSLPSVVAESDHVVAAVGTVPVPFLQPDVPTAPPKPADVSPRIITAGVASSDPKEDTANRISPVSNVDLLVTTIAAIASDNQLAAPSSTHADAHQLTATHSPLPSASQGIVATPLALPVTAASQLLGQSAQADMGQHKDEEKSRKDTAAMPLPITTPVTPASSISTIALPVVAAPITQATQQLVAQATWVQTGQSTEMRLRLRPPELGDVNVIMRRDTTGALTATLIPATTAAYAVLQANMHHLRAALVPHSLGTPPDVQLIGSEEQFQSNNHSFQSRQQPDHTYTGSDAPLLDSSAAVPTQLLAVRRSRGLIDYDA